MCCAANRGSLLHLAQRTPPPRAVRRRDFAPRVASCMVEYTRRSETKSPPNPSICVHRPRQKNAPVIEQTWVMSQALFRAHPCVRHPFPPLAPARQAHVWGRPCTRVLGKGLRAPSRARQRALERTDLNQAEKKRLSFVIVDRKEDPMLLACLRPARGLFF